MQQCARYDFIFLHKMSSTCNLSTANDVQHTIWKEAERIGLATINQDIDMEDFKEDEQWRSLIHAIALEPDCRWLIVFQAVTEKNGKKTERCSYQISTDRCYKDFYNLEKVRNPKNRLVLCWLKDEEKEGLGFDTQILFMQESTVVAFRDLILKQIMLAFTNDPAERSRWAAIIAQFNRFNQRTLTTTEAKRSQFSADAKAVWDKFVVRYLGCSEFCRSKNRKWFVDEIFYEFCCGIDFYQDTWRDSSVNDHLPDGRTVCKTPGPYFNCCCQEFVKDMPAVIVQPTIAAVVEEEETKLPAIILQTGTNKRKKAKKSSPLPKLCEEMKTKAQISSPEIVATSWRELLRLPAAESFDAIRLQFRKLYMQANPHVLELPIPIELHTSHPVYGEVDITAILWWIDAWDTQFAQPKQVDSHQLEYFIPGVDSEGQKIYDANESQPRRICWFHQIQEIRGDAKFTPAATMIGKMFSSLHVSANLITQGRENGFDAWHVLGTNVSLSHYVSTKDNQGRWINCTDFDQRPMLFKDTSIEELPCRDLFAGICVNECNVHRCRMPLQLPCYHNELHVYERESCDALLKDGEKKKPSVLKASVKNFRTKQTAKILSTRWGRAIWFSTISCEQFNNNMTFPYWFQLFIDVRVRPIARQMFPYLALQFSWIYVFPVEFLGTDENLDLIKKLFRYYQFQGSAIAGRIKPESQKWESVEDAVYVATMGLADEHQHLKLFGTPLKNSFLKDTAYGVNIYVKLSHAVYKALHDTQLALPLESFVQPEVSRELTVFEKIQLESSSSSIDAVTVKPRLERLVVVTSKIYAWLIEQFHTGAGALHARSVRGRDECRVQLDAKRVEYDALTFYNPTRNTEFSKKVNVLEGELNMLQQQYLVRAQWVAYFERGEESLEEGWMLQERERAFWNKERAYKKYDASRDWTIGADSIAAAVTT